MFKKWGEKTGEAMHDENINEQPVNEVASQIKDAVKGDTHMDKNRILKGSKLVGDIRITCDMELSGDIEGNITSEKDSNIVIKGTCRGNIETIEGNVEIEGEINGGNITAGNDVKILGKFDGGEIKASGRISIEGEFSGKLQGNEIEIGPTARGKGELFYKEHISIAKGANIEAQISRIQGELKLIKNTPETKIPVVSAKANKSNTAN
jgi:cytoskeletal protein CcmA (bactofilin family)